MRSPCLIDHSRCYIDPDCAAAITNEQGGDAEVDARAAAEVDNGFVERDRSQAEGIPDRGRGLPDDVRDVVQPSRVVSQIPGVFFALAPAEVPPRMERELRVKDPNFLRGAGNGG